MCLAIPGKIIKIDNKTAIVQYPNEQRKVMLDPNIPTLIGDYVLVQMMVVIQKVTEDEALSSWKAWDEIEQKV